jgi:hypothetical protein
MQVPKAGFLDELMPRLAAWEAGYEPSSEFSRPAWATGLPSNLLRRGAGHVDDAVHAVREKAACGRVGHCIHNGKHLLRGSNRG